MRSYIRIAEEDIDNAIRNRYTIFGAYGGAYGSGAAAYNAVISVLFSDEAEAEPVTLEEAKLWCRIDVSEDDPIVTALITAARIVCETYANISFIPRTVTATINNGLGNFRLPYGPVLDITTITDSEGEEVTDYDVKDSYGGNLTLTYETGYETIPGNLKTALLMQIAFMYQNRGDEKMGSGVSEFAKLILKQIRDV